MGLLSDRQIKSRCLQPYGVLQQNTNPLTPHALEWVPVIPGITHSMEQVGNWETRGYSRFHKFRGKNEEERLADMKRFIDWKPMISPFVAEPVRFKGKQKIISYGTSSFGYDIRIKSEGIKLFTNLSGQIVDPMRPYTDQLVDPVIHYDEEFDLHYFVLPPNSLALAHTVEYFCIPRDILVTCLGKSTYARVGLSQIATPLEPEWEGELVLEIASMTNSPTRVYLGCGIAQLLWHQGNEPCEVSYKDKGGKYMYQMGTTLARV